MDSTDAQPHGRHRRPSEGAAERPDRIEIDEGRKGLRTTITCCGGPSLCGAPERQSRLRPSTSAAANVSFAGRSS